MCLLVLQTAVIRDKNKALFHGLLMFGARILSFSDIAAERAAKISLLNSLKIKSDICLYRRRKKLI